MTILTAAPLAGLVLLTLIYLFLDARHRRNLETISREYRDKQIHNYNKE